jgi:hypothetical protein
MLPADCGVPSFGGCGGLCQILLLAAVLIGLGFSCGGVSEGYVAVRAELVRPSGWAVMYRCIAAAGSSFESRLLKGLLGVLREHCVLLAASASGLGLCGASRKGVPEGCVAARPELVLLSGWAVIYRWVQQSLSDKREAYVCALVTLRLYLALLLLLFLVVCGLPEEACLKAVWWSERSWRHHAAGRLCTIS